MNIFSFAYWMFVYLLRKYVLIFVIRVLYIFWIGGLYQINHLQIFLPTSLLSLTFLIVSFEAQKFLILIKSNLPTFSLVVSSIMSKKLLSNSRSWRFACMLCRFLVLTYFIQFSFLFFNGLWYQVRDSISFFLPC